MRTTVTRESHPNFWSLFALVSATMDQSVKAGVSVACSPDELNRLDAQLGSWPLSDVVALAGVVESDRFSDVVVSVVGALAAEVLSSS